MIKKHFCQKHNGIGGLYFITTSIICSFIMTMALQLSWNSQAVAIANNVSNIVATNVAVHNYLNNSRSYVKLNPTINISSGGTYDPLNDFNQTLLDMGIMQEASDKCKVTWVNPGGTSEIEFNYFKTKLGTSVKPDPQKYIIERN